MAADDVLWTGSKLVVIDRVFGNTGGIYEPCKNTWTQLATTGVERYAPAMVVPTGILYFESVPMNTGWATRLSLLDVAGNAWTDVPASSVPPNQKRAVVWTGDELIWWGGALQHPEIVGPGHWEDRNDGGVFDLATQTFKSISTSNAPEGRVIDGNAVWTGTELVVWGGWSAVDPTATTELDYCFNSGDYEQCQRFGDGGIYDRATDSWKAVSSTGAPSARTGHLMVWTGTDVLVIEGGGFTSPGLWSRFGDAYRYNLAADQWAPIVLPDPLKAAITGTRTTGDRSFEWTGTHLLLKIAGSPNYAYDSSGDSWQIVADPPSSATCPPGASQGVCTAPGGARFYGLYDPSANRWTLLDYPVRDSTLKATSTVWTGSQLIEWGGYRLGMAPDAGGCPPNTACDLVGAPMLYTAEGAVFTPAR
jgi:hypothetical protein